MPLKPQTGFWLPALLAPMIAFETFSIDTLVPGFPDMARSLSLSDGTVQLTVAFFLIGYAISQLVMGSLSDRFGRRNILLSNLLLMTIATYIPVISSDITFILASRLILGLSAGGCLSAGIAVIRDIYHEDKMSRVLGYVYSCCGFFSVLCGIVGGYVAAHYGWRGNFTALFLIAAYLLISIFLLLPETRPVSTRISSFAEWKRETRILFHSRTFLRYLFSGALIYSTMLVFISSIAFVMDGLFKIDAQTLGWCFAVMVLGYSIGAITSALVSADKMSDFKTALVLSVTVIASGLLPFYGHFNVDPVYYITGLLFIVDFVVGFYGPVNTSGVSGPFPHLSGTAISILASIGLIVGAAAGFASTHFYDGTIWPMTFTMLTTSILGLSSFLFFSPESQGAQDPYVPSQN